MKINDFAVAAQHYLERAGCRPGPVMGAFIDMDGTLYDSMPCHAKAWHRMVTELGIKADEDEFYAYEGMTGKATINLLFAREGRSAADDAEVTRLYARKAEYFRRLYTGKLMPGAREMVLAFRNAGVDTVLVTGSAQTSVIDQVNVDYDGCFPPERRITAHDVTKGKPDPEPYLKALLLCGLQPRNAVVVENAPLGVQSGFNAGIFTIGVTTGPMKADVLAGAGADIVFNSMTECAEMLPGLLSYLNGVNAG